MILILEVPQVTGVKHFLEKQLGFEWTKVALSTKVPVYIPFHCNVIKLDTPKGFQK